MRKKGSVISFLFILGLIVLIYLVVLLTPEPPMKQIEVARNAIVTARKAGGEKYAPDLFHAAEQAYKMAIEYWEYENKRFILVRNYNKIDSCCQSSIEFAQRANNHSRINSHNLEIALEARISELKAMAECYNGLMNLVPVSKNTRQSYLKGKMLLNEAIVDFRNRQFISCDEKLKYSQDLMNASVTELLLIMEDYFKNYPQWMDMYSTSLRKSSTDKCYLIVVDKLARKCQVYKNGKLKRTYNIELGANWMGDKRSKGDKTTPEGVYYVVGKLDKGRSKYYKALMIDYPNEEDRLRFKTEKKNGSLPPHADIGNSIEIHGHGGKGADWTNGCIALRDEDMRELFEMIPVNTQVTIVGSLIPINKILKY